MSNIDFSFSNKKAKKVKLTWHEAEKAQPEYFTYIADNAEHKYSNYYIRRNVLENGDTEYFGRVVNAMQQPLDYHEAVQHVDAVPAHFTYTAKGVTQICTEPVSYDEEAGAYFFINNGLEYDRKRVALIEE